MEALDVRKIVEQLGIDEDRAAEALREIIELRAAGVGVLITAAGAAVMEKLQMA